MLGSAASCVASEVTPSAAIFRLSPTDLPAVTTRPISTPIISMAAIANLWHDSSIHYLSLPHSPLWHYSSLVMPWVSWRSASPRPLLLLAMLGRSGASREGSIRVGRGDPARDRHHISWPLRYWLGEISSPASLGRGRLHHGRPCRIISPALLPQWSWAFSTLTHR
jgi:hypothetical protein